MCHWDRAEEPLWLQIKSESDNVNVLMTPQRVTAAWVTGYLQGSRNVVGKAGGLR